ncbi:MAG: biotin carboxylase N-terminal domain-containing protein [Hyphomicrobiales bacterium]
MKRVLIANRGEIALRAVRACRKAGLETVAIYSQPDENSPHCWVADRRVCIGPAPANASYLRAGTLIEAAKATGCDAIYPGYGFLSEKADFARACAEEKLIFIGPSPEAIATMGDKVAARNTAEKNGLPIVPGSPSGFTDVRLANEASSSIGFPILLKAAGGGGGRGMRVVDDPAQFDSQFAQASAEAGAAFGQSDVYLERFFRRVRHI